MLHMNIADTYCFAECCYGECCYAECCYAECRGAAKGTFYASEVARN